MRLNMFSRYKVEVKACRANADKEDEEESKQNTVEE